MKKAEKIIGALALLGIVLKFLLVNGSGLLTVVSLSVLSLLYCFFGFALFNGIRLRNIFKKESYQGMSPPKMIGTIGLGFSLSEITMGILYKFQSYNGAMMQLTTGLFFTIVILIVALIQYKKNKSIFYISIFTRIIIVGGLGLVILLTPTDSLRKVLHRNDPDYLEQINSQQ